MIGKRKFRNLGEAEAYIERIEAQRDEDVRKIRHLEAALAAAETTNMVHMEEMREQGRRAQREAANISYGHGWSR